MDWSKEKYICNFWNYIDKCSTNIKKKFVSLRILSFVLPLYYSQFFTLIPLDCPPFLRSLYPDHPLPNFIIFHPSNCFSFLHIFNLYTLVYGIYGMICFFLRSTNQLAVVLFDSCISRPPRILLPSIMSNSTSINGTANGTWKHIKNCNIFDVLYPR